MQTLSATFLSHRAHRRTSSRHHSNPCPHLLRHYFNPVAHRSQPPHASHAPPSRIPAATISTLSRHPAASHAPSCMPPRHHNFNPCLTCCRISSPAVLSALLVMLIRFSPQTVQPPPLCPVAPLPYRLRVVPSGILGMLAPHTFTPVW